MNQVITAEQARKITGGRKPLEIVSYVTAVTALKECLVLDDVKYWDNLADAYAAWGKIHRSQEIIHLAKALKLKAAQRLGELALQIRPAKGRGARRNDLTGRLLGGSSPGPVSVLIEQGLSKADATKCTRLARHPDIVDRAVDLKNPPSPGTVLARMLTQSAWNRFRYMSNWSAAHRGMSDAKPRDVAVGAAHDSRDIELIRRQAVFMYEWLDEFIQHLPE